MKYKVLEDVTQGNEQGSFEFKAGEVEPADEAERVALEQLAAAGLAEPVGEGEEE